MLLDFLASPRWVDSSVFGFTGALDNFLRAVGEKFDDAQKEIKASCANVQKFNYTFYGKHDKSVISSIIRSKLDDAVFSTVLVGSADVTAKVTFNFPDDKLEFTFDWCPECEHFIGGATGDSVKYLYDEDKRALTEYKGLPAAEEQKAIPEKCDDKCVCSTEPEKKEYTKPEVVVKEDKRSVAEKLKERYKDTFVDYDANVLKFLDDVFSDDDFPFEPIYDEDGNVIALSMDYTINEGDINEEDGWDVPCADDVDWERVAEEVCYKYGFSDVCFGPENGTFMLKFIF